MALVFKFDPEQLQTLVTAINSLSDNLAKWQGEQTGAITQGFADLVETFGGIVGDDVQARIDQLRDDVKTEADALEGSAQSGD
jgi:hypothetical protein